MSQGAPGRPLPVLAGTRGPPTSWSVPGGMGQGARDLSPPSRFWHQPFQCSPSAWSTGALTPHAGIGSPSRPGLLVAVGQGCLMLPVLFLPLCPMVSGVTALPPARPFPLGTPWPSRC